jgi:hypothetical protein
LIVGRCITMLRELPLIAVELYPNMNALTIEVIERRYDGLHDCEFGLDTGLDGLEQLLAED